jgi:hypothetical protein
METKTQRLAFLGGLLAALMMSCSLGGLELTVRFQEADGLSQGAPVFLGDRPIGRVAKVTQRDGGYGLALAIDRAAAGQVTEHSRFLIVNHPHEPMARAVEMVITDPGGKPLRNGALVEGSSGMAALGARMQQHFGAATEALRQQLESLVADIEGLAEGEEVRQMERELDRLLKEIERLGEEMQATARDEILPRLREQIQKIRRALEQKGRSEDMEGIERRMRRIEGVLEV